MNARIALTSVGLVLAWNTFAAANDGTVRTEIKRGHNSAVIVQSGDPKTAKVRIEQRPGYLHIEQRSHNNSVTVIQSTSSD